MPSPDCGRVVNGDEVKRQAQAGTMGEQLYAVAYKRRVEIKTKSGKPSKKKKWIRGLRASSDKDDNGALISDLLASKLARMGSE